MTIQGHNYIGHNYVGHNNVGHNNVGHNYIEAERRRQSNVGLMAPPWLLDRNGAPAIPDRRGVGWWEPGLANGWRMWAPKTSDTGQEVMAL